MIVYAGMTETEMLHAEWNMYAAWLGDDHTSRDFPLPPLPLQNNESMRCIASRALQQLSRAALIIELSPHFHATHAPWWRPV